TNRENFGVRIFIENRKPNLYLQRNAIAHSAFLALLLIVLMFQSNRLSAVLAELWPNEVESAAFMTECLACCERIHLYTRAARFTVGSQIVQAFQPAALTLPVTDLILDEIEGRGTAEV